jgi:hypothetical protein
VETVARDEEQRRIEELWMPSVKAYHERERRERCVAWWGFETRLARLHAQLASEHEAKAREWGLQVEQMDRVEENGHKEGDR